METKTVRKKRTIPYNFSEKHIGYIKNCIECEINVAEGTIRAGKTVDNIYAFAYVLRNTEDRIHLATGSTVDNAKLNIGDANGFGLEYIFRGQSSWGKYKSNEALFICARKWIIFDRVTYDCKCIIHKNIAILKDIIS
ncbi:hypothetical protein [Anaerorhabdus sp.]|uniref:hypothetical protein n=1 Tax=Anaerorhabdus sp. TaxID=1872524 RepID=UPI002FCB7C17